MSKNETKKVDKSVGKKPKIEVPVPPEQNRIMKEEVHPTPRPVPPKVMGDEDGNSVNKDEVYPVPRPVPPKVSSYKDGTE